MSVRDAFAALARGERPDDGVLLGNCRLEWRGGEAYGEEAVLELSRAAPFDLGEATIIECAVAAACIAGQTALFADLYDGRIGRLWRIGPGIGAPAEPAVAVAFDPDLHQTRGALAIRAADHPALDSEGFTALAKIGTALVRPTVDAPAHRIRSFAIRAFSSGGRHAALFALHRLSAGEVRTSGFAYAAALFGANEAMVVTDHPRAIAWTPRL